MASLSPLIGRLSQIFSLRSCILSSAVLFVAGGLLAGHPRSFTTFISGRVLSGAGGAGVMTLVLILVIELAGTKRRGLFLGVTNAGFTTGVALGAVVAGGLVGITGWVSLLRCRHENRKECRLICCRDRYSGARRHLPLLRAWAYFGGSPHGLGRLLLRVGRREVWRINSRTWITRARLYSCVSHTQS